MDEMLRGWLEGRCRARPDGTWLVEVPVLSTEPTPAFVLPHVAAKDAYLALAVQLGRFRLLSEFLLTLLGLAVAIRFNMTVVLDHQNAVGLRLAALLLVLVLVALHLAWVKRGSDRLRAWLHRTGEEAPEAERVGEEQRPRWWPEWREALKRCRPGWMVIADAAVFCVFVASHALFSLALQPHCRQALVARRGAETPLWPLPDGCFDLGAATWLGMASWFTMAAWFAAGRALASRDWWHWNRRRA